MRNGACLLLLILFLLAGPAPAGPSGDGAPLAPLADEAWTYETAAHLLRRAGFGGTVAEIRELHALGLAGAVDKLLDWSAPEKDVPSPVITVTSRPGRKEYMGKMDREARQEIFREWRRKDQFQQVRIREWWMHMMIRTRHPARERLTLFWHGHFTSSFRDVRNSYHMYVQNTLLRRYAAGNFRTLLHGISRDPAMLEYLDNNRNRKANPNENYAREVMELFTLGAGNYTEKDIKEAARALTGWTFLGNTFVNDVRQHDDGVKTILGRTGNFDGDAFLDLLLEQPAACRYIATRLFRYFAHEFPDKEVIDGLARSLRRNEWELKPVLRQLFSSRAFYSEHAMGTRIKGPVEFVVGLFRSLGLDGRGHLGLSGTATALGQSLMDPPNVKGWPGGREWISTSMLLNRYNLAGALVGLGEDKRRAMQAQGGKGMRDMAMLQRMRRVDPNGEEMDGMDMGIGEAEMGMGPGRRGRGRYQAPTFDVLDAVVKHGLTEPDEIVDHFCRALLANPPSAEMRATLLDYLTQDVGFSLTRRDAAGRLHGLLRLIVSTPEFQLS